MSLLTVVHGRGTTAAKPAAAAANEGYIYFDTTLGKLQRSNGATWDDISETTGGSGSITASGYTQATARMLGRTTAATGAIEEITVGSGLTLAAGSLTASATAPAGTILGETVQTAADQSITSATLADLPTNVAVTFTVPASGSVDVEFSATAGGTATANAYQTWGVREGTTIIAGAVGESIAVRQAGSGGEGLQGAFKIFRITGLTPAASLTYKWAAAASTSGATFKASTNSPAIMRIVQVA